MIEPFDHPLVRRLVRLALEEDIGRGDLTTALTVDSGLDGRATIVTRQPIVVAGLGIVPTIFGEHDVDAEIEILVEDGARMESGAVLLEVVGGVAPILTVERTVLNFLQRLCGVATLTARYVDAVAGTSTRVVDTRKTIPGWRLLDKYAVRAGGGSNHRFGLDDGVLIKDNHGIAGDVVAALGRAKTQLPHLTGIEVECETLADVERVLEAGVGAILLDNMSVDQLRQAVALVRSRAPGVILEASGMVNLDTIRAVAETGVDLVSVGALTHSATAVDLSLELAAS